jgi:hypothetical protein
MGKGHDWLARRTAWINKVQKMKGKTARLSQAVVWG